jgi:hypothetical protein
MLTIEQLPKDTTDRIIEILSEDGVTKKSVQACAFGLASTNLGITGPEEAVKRINEIRHNRLENNREYVTQVLTIYSNAVAGEMLDLIGLAYGAPDSSKMDEIKKGSDEVIKETVAKYLPEFVETLDN